MPRWILSCYLLYKTKIREFSILLMASWLGDKFESTRRDFSFCAKQHWRRWWRGTWTYRRCRLRRGCRTRWRWLSANVRWTGCVGAGRRQATAPRRQPKKTQYPAPSLFVGQHRSALCQVPATANPRKCGKMGGNRRFADTLLLRGSSRFC